MASTVLTLINGVKYLEPRKWSIPQADIGDTIGYLPVGAAADSKAFLEAKVVQIEMQQMLDKATNKIVEAIMYTLANGHVVMESEMGYVNPESSV